MSDSSWFRKEFQVIVKCKISQMWIILSYIRRNNVLCTDMA